MIKFLSSGYFEQGPRTGPETILAVITSSIVKSMPMDYIYHWWPTSTYPEDIVDLFTSFNIFPMI